MFEPRDPRLFELVRAAVIEGETALELATRTGYVPRHSNWPKLGLFDSSGLPHVTTAAWEAAPLNYSAAFGREVSQFIPVAYQELPAFLELIAYGREHSALRERFAHPSTADDATEVILEWSIVQLATAIIERLRSTARPCDKENIAALYGAIEFAAFEPELPIEVLVPLLCVTSPVEDRIKLADDLFLERLDERTQLARARLHHLAPVQDVLLGAATHALVLAGPTIPNVNAWDQQRPEALVPLGEVERALQAIRIASRYPVGYAQIVLRPIGWARHWTADLPPLEGGPVLRRYPSFLDEYGWLRTPPRLDETVLVESGRLYAALATAAPRVVLAARRYSQALLRDHDEDRVIDACVGLEALLGGGTSNEITFKLALRASTLLSMPPANLNPIKVFKCVRQALCVPIACRSRFWKDEKIRAD